MITLQIDVEDKGTEKALKGLTTENFHEMVYPGSLVLRNVIIGGTPVDQGELKRSWGDVERTSTGFTFGTGKDYATVLEEGLYKGVGKRTMKFEGKIFSKQAPGGIIKPQIEDKETQRKFLKAVIRQLNEMIGE